ncbi:MAG: metal ABC transporter permease [Zestosphaera sp.]
MRTFRLIILYTAVATILSVLNPLFKVEFKWNVTFTALGLLFGSLSPLIATRRLYYLSAAAPHASLFSVALSMLIAGALGISDYYVTAIFVSTLLVLGVGYMIRSGLDPDVATSVFVSSTTALSVLLMYYVLTKYRLTSINAIMLGDPLLIPYHEVLMLTVMSVLVLVVVLTTFKESVCAGIDSDLVKLSGVKAILYDLIPYALVGLVAVTSLKLVGYVLSHVLALLPSLTSINVSKQARESLIHSIGLTTIATLTGLPLSTHFNVSPSGTVGILLTLFYLMTLVKRRMP